MDNLPFIIWNDSFSVGVKLMDNQHQFLLGVINNLFNASQKGGADSEIIKIINQMVDYTRFHFSSEEIMLTNISYPELNMQKNEHRLFTQQVLEFQDMVILRKMSVNLEALDFLKNWWTTHIKGHDRLYTKFLIEKGYKIE